MTAEWLILTTLINKKAYPFLNDFFCPPNNDSSSGWFVIWNFRSLEKHMVLP